MQKLEETPKRGKPSRHGAGGIPFFGEVRPILGAGAVV
jgi:hypothetical protein